MINYKYCFLIIVITLGGCEKTSSASYHVNQKLEKKVISNPSDSVIVNITNNYNLEILNGSKYHQNFDFFQPIKNDLIKEKYYTQIIYDRNNIIINTEIGENANIYEDYYLSKSIPIKIDKIVRTTINKNSSEVEKLMCSEIVNEILSSSTKYRPLNNKLKKCVKTLQK
ncbi:hypothetical protein [Frigoriflavimonas asaccharolytica]|uniref:Lipoprotein n=1 Tax=Frigoriflavimonas asaccharolytica TaxID=2735899 RepID=A0A8J8GC81_9FLAO|nr:hypothetical protein [Frigoriflavimonas asaccharolytica]NRS93852.1 hypothetical protein [Frigoriflavimonas asaccharolytica]